MIRRRLSHAIARGRRHQPAPAATDRDLSQEEIADRAGINRNYVGMFEREEHAATVDMLEKLAAVLDSDPLEFFRRQQ